ncbi:hypothetical protein [Akkermansia muciniphila]|uniref:hypothetical protein n=1 Tax=Akkermansia muciniphila TaxID=239935 RepID=UPI000FE3DCB5|nr:hypothetical protein [Akkermansia muciniphila]MCL6665376.1 hypothetical protein [Akkermansia muciniphila]
MDYIRFHRLAVKPKADMERILFLSSFRFLLQAMGALFPLNKVKRPQDCSRGRSNLLPMKTSLIH